MASVPQNIDTTIINADEPIVVSIIPSIASMSSPKPLSNISSDLADSTPTVTDPGSTIPRTLLPLQISQSDDAGWETPRPGPPSSITPRPRSPVAAGSPQKIFDFMMLPPRVRAQIYREILVHEYDLLLQPKRPHRRLTEAKNPKILTVGQEKSVRKPGDKTVPRGVNTASPVNLFLVSREFRDVGLQIYYGENHFLFASDIDFTRWTKSITFKRSKLVRHLIFRSRWNAYFQENNLYKKSLRFDGVSGIMKFPDAFLFPNLLDFTIQQTVYPMWQMGSYELRYGKVDSKTELKFAKWILEKCNNGVKAFRKAFPELNADVSTDNRIEVPIEMYIGSDEWRQKVAEDKAREKKKLEVKKQATGGQGAKQKALEGKSEVEEKAPDGQQVALKDASAE